MKQYRKNVQKTKVKAVGRSGNESKETKKSKVKKLGKTELKSAKSSIKTATSGLGESVKGQFGDKVVEVLDNQTKLLDDF